MELSELSLRARHKKITSRVESFERRLEHIKPWLDPKRTDWGGTTGTSLHALGGGQRIRAGYLYGFSFG